MSAMTGRERVRRILAGKAADRCALWLGKPLPETWTRYHAYFGTTDEEAIRRELGDDFRWISPQWGSYRHPAGKPIFDSQPRGRELAAQGIFADVEEVARIHELGWPDPAYLDFSDTLALLDEAGDAYRASGFWCSFFHDVSGFFGMERYFEKMFTHPEVVHAVTRHVVDFYLAGNERFFAAAGDRMDAFFYGNDLGTQRGLLIGPRQLAEFYFPYARELVEQARACGYQVIQHSCGAVHDIIPDLIGLGLDGLHPLQALAKGMDAETLARDFKGRVAFIGGIDTQELLVHGTPDDVRAEVARVQALLGPALVISPSHEGLLPNVPPENVVAMAQAATAAPVWKDAGMK